MPSRSHRQKPKPSKIGCPACEYDGWLFNVFAKMPCLCQPELQKAWREMQVRASEAHAREMALHEAVAGLEAERDFFKAKMRAAAVVNGRIERLAAQLEVAKDALGQLASVRALWHPSSEVTTEVRMRIAVAEEANARIDEIGNGI